MFGHRYFGSRYFGAHYFGPTVGAGSGSGSGSGSGGGGVPTPVPVDCNIPYVVRDDCCNQTPPSPIIVGPPGPQGPPGPPGGTACEWCCPIFCAPGSPEGVVTSPIGGVYEQTDAALTTHSWWAKRSGIGNTGWRAWSGLRGAATGSLAIGDNSDTTGGTDGIAIGESTVVSAARGVSIGKGSVVGFIEGISVGDAATKNPNDIAVGWGHALGRSGAAVTVYPNIVVGKSATIGSVDDPSASTQAGGHVLIGYNNTVPYDKTNWPNTIIGHTAQSNGHAAVVIGHLAESRVANSPIAGRSAGQFAVVIGYASKASGGCVLAIGDQADVRHDNSAAVGTHARAQDGSTAALGPNCFAGSVAADNSGLQASAIGVANQALGFGSTSVGSNNVVKPKNGIALGQLAFINSLFEGAIGIGLGPAPFTPRQIMIGDSGSNGGDRVYAIHFNGAAQPAFLVTWEGFIQQVNPVVASTRTYPITSDLTPTADDYNLFMSSAGGLRTVTLPAAAGVAVGKRYFIRRDTATANNVVIAAQPGEFVGLAASYTLTAQWKYAVVRNSGVVGNEWRIDESN